MKVLHIWDQAGTASLMSKYQKEYLHYELSAVIQDKKHDFIGITKYYNQFLYSKLPFLMHALSASRLYDIIHLHDSWFMILPLKILYPKKKIIMHYHGTLIRSNYLGKKRRFLEKFVNKILVATPDLLEYEYLSPPEYIPDPIDVNLFHRRKPNLNNKAFCLLKMNQDITVLDWRVHYMGFDLKIETQTRVKGYHNGIPYCDFNKKLEQFEYYIDIPMYEGKIIKANSCAGLQAMNQGLKVICHDGSIKNELPAPHEPENVVNVLDIIYNEVLEKDGRVKI